MPYLPQVITTRRGSSASARSARNSANSRFIMPKIREIDDFLLAKPADQCQGGAPGTGFWGLNRRRPWCLTKKRAAVITNNQTAGACLPGSRKLVNKAMQSYPRNLVLRDDIVDALVCLLVARSSTMSCRPCQRLCHRIRRGLPWKSFSPSIPITDDFDHRLNTGWSHGMQVISTDNAGLRLGEARWLAPGAVIDAV